MLAVLEGSYTLLRAAHTALQKGGTMPLTSLQVAVAQNPYAAETPDHHRWDTGYNHGCNGDLQQRFDPPYSAGWNSGIVEFRIGGMALPSVALRSPVLAFRRP